MVLVISAVEGVQPQTRILMRVWQRLRVPTLIFVNKIDRRGARYVEVLQEISERLTPAVVAMGSVRDLGTRAADFTPSDSADAGFAGLAFVRSCNSAYRVRASGMWPHSARAAFDSCESQFACGHCVVGFSTALWAKADSLEALDRRRIQRPALWRGAEHRPPPRSRAPLRCRRRSPGTPPSRLLASMAYATRLVATPHRSPSPCRRTVFGGGTTTRAAFTAGVLHGDALCQPRV